MRVERRGCIIQFLVIRENCCETGGTKMSETKPFQIERQLVMDAYVGVKANRGSGGVDGMSLEAFDKDYKHHLYKIWNKMSSGSYMPPLCDWLRFQRKVVEYDHWVFPLLLIVLPKR